MAQYPIKLMKDESGQPFVPLTSIKAVVGEEYIQTALLAEQVSTGHFVITNDKITDSDILNKIVAVSFPDEITATTNSYLKINEENEYLIYDEDGTGPLLIKDFAHVICFLMRKEDKWQLVKTGAAATAASGGHTIVDNEGNVMPQQKVLQFKGFGVSDNASTGATVISTPALVNNLSTSESGTGPLDAYQGKVLNDKLDSSLQNYLPYSGGRLTGPLSFQDTSLEQFSSSPSYLVGIEGFADGGELKWQEVGAITVGKAINDGNGNNISTTYLPKTGGTITGDLEVEGTLAAGYSTQSSFPTGKIKVHDLRNITITPSMTTKGANFYFDNENSPMGGWYSVLHVTGWSTDYSTWQLAGPSNNADQRTTALYTRAGNSGSGFGSWRKIYDSGNTGDMQCGGSVYANGGYLLSKCNGVTTQIGAQNGSFTHYTTNSSNGHWFNKTTYVQGSLYKGSGYNLNVPAVFIQSGTPSASQVGDIWFVT